MARGPWHWRTVGGLIRESCTSQPGGAPGQKAAAQSLSLYDQTTACVAASLDTANTWRLTECHSGSTERCHKARYQQWLLRAPPPRAGRGVPGAAVVIGGFFPPRPWYWNSSGSGFPRSVSEFPG